MTQVVHCLSLDDLVHHLGHAKKLTSVTTYHNLEDGSFGFQTNDVVYSVSRDNVKMVHCQKIFLNHVVWDAFVAAFPEKLL